MLNYFPKYFSNRAIALYFAVLLACFIVFFQHSMKWYFYIFGIVSVVGFFYFSNYFTTKWKNISVKKFTQNLFIYALVIRFIWVIFSYFFYIQQTGIPFEWETADAWGYNQCGTEIAAHLREGNWSIFSVYLQIFGPADTGYISYLGVLYYLVDDSILITRILKALLSAFMCVLIYKLTTRNFGESTGRIAGVLSMLMPHFIYYCSMHLKETEMIFLAVAFVERADYLLRSKKFNFINIAIPLLLAFTLFFFRTVLGVAALMAFFTAIVFSSEKVVGWGKRILVGIWIVAIVGYFFGGRIATEVEEVWEGKDENQQTSMQYRATKGNTFAEYGSVAIFAPMIFAAPFPTVINIDTQKNMMMMNGSNFVKNITAFFTMLGIFLLIYRNQWREHLLILSFLVSYLVVIAMSAFAISERFHLPSVPFALIIASYGISQMDNQKKKYFNYWTILIFFIIIGWSWFKLAGRGWI